MEAVLCAHTPLTVCSVTISEDDTHLFRSVHQSFWEPESTYWRPVCDCGVQSGRLCCFRGNLQRAAVESFFRDPSGSRRGSAETWRRQKINSSALSVDSYKWIALMHHVLFYLFVASYSNVTKWNLTTTAVIFTTSCQRFKSKPATADRLKEQQFCPHLRLTLPCSLSFSDLQMQRMIGK